MKNIFKLSLTALSLFLVVSCTTNPASESNNPSISDEPSISEDNSTSIEPVKPVSKWGEQYSDLIIGTLGEDIPYIECPSFDIELSYDDYGDPMVVFYLYFKEADFEAKLDEYGGIADAEGYLVSLETVSYWDPNYGRISYDVYFADKEISSSRGIEMQILIGSHNYRDCIGIFAYNYVVDNPNYWPTNLVESLLGYDVPHLEDTGEYEYYAKINPEGYIDMIIYNVSSTADDDYCALLEAYDYLVTDEMYDEDTGEYMGRFAYSPDGDVCIQFGLSQYGLEIYIYKLS
ncbi:MAG: hypothetical protein J1F31_02580 [Erysipelotrichales bacterium]|nr:hypothetical protein [Erysipelotrichales bacterium]